MVKDKGSMNKKKIEEIFNKHFEGLGEYFNKKAIQNKEKSFDDFYYVPLPTKDLISGTIFNTCNIRYGDFLEEIINEFLIENGAIIPLEDKRKGNYDLLFKIDDILYVGEIKIRDNHDSTKKLGQISNLTEKALLQKEKNDNLKVIAIFFFIDPNEKKNRKFYLEELNLCVDKHLFDDAKVFYGDEIFDELKLTNEWKKLKNDIVNFNIKLKRTNHIFKIINNYLKGKYDEIEYNEIIRRIKLFN